MQFSIEEAVFEAVKRASTVLPPDIVAALRKAAEQEEEGSNARMAFDAILENVELAAKHSVPICQDTGWPTFFVQFPAGWSQRRMRREIEAAVARAAERSILRPNAVDSVSGKNSGNCVGIGIPTVYFSEVDGPSFRIDLLLKGGGSENVSAQFSLPNPSLSAGRDLDGVFKIVLKAVNNAQGRGCGPAVLGVGIGGDRAHSFSLAKRQLLRPLTDSNPDPRLAELERRILDAANELGIGPMGFGGKNTVLGVKVGYAHRHPASFFVSVAYFCWAARRSTILFDAEGDYKVVQ